MVCYGKQIRQRKRYVLEDQLVRCCLRLDFLSVNVGNIGSLCYQGVTCHLTLLAPC